MVVCLGRCMFGRGKADESKDRGLQVSMMNSESD